MKAKLQSDFTKLSVNRESRIVEGVKLLENNRDVTYKSADGKAMGFRTNDALLSGLMAHAGNRTIPSHLSHEWSDGKRDGLHDRVGGIKNCRLSANGDLIGDAHVMPGTEGDRILWLAENDPEHCMLSCIFDYNAIKTDGVTYAYPLSFESADFVAKGAGVTAMLSQFPTDTDMTKDEIVALIKENSASKDDVTAAVKAALSDFKPAGTLTQDDLKAALAAHAPKLSEEELVEIGTQAEAKLVAKLGSGTLQINVGPSKESNDYTAKLAEYTKTSPNPGTAILRLLSDHPELGSQHEAHLQTQVAKLNAA